MNELFTRVETWSEYRIDITNMELKIFKEALNGLTSIHYHPMDVAIQNRVKIKYSSFCMQLRNSQELPIILH